MRVLLAPDKFRGSFTAAEVCRHVARGMRAADPGVFIEPLPLADGGEGTLDVLQGVLGGTRTTLTVRGPAGDPISAVVGVTPDGVALIESARFCGLSLVPSHLRDPMTTTSYGLGQAIASLLDSGVTGFLIGLGGSATIDGGLGMARALGYRFPDPHSVDDTLVHQALSSARFTILCDVQNPLLGPDGSVPVFGPQKGATPASLPLLESRLAALVDGLASWKGRPAADLASLPMGGAAGGLGLGCALFLAGNLVPGAPFILDHLGFSAKLAAADLLVTGEGSFDRQSLAGKASCAAIERACAVGRATAVVTGCWDGTRPEPHPQAFKVFTDEGAVGAPLDAEGLALLGAEVSRWAGLTGVSAGRT